MPEEGTYVLFGTYSKVSDPEHALGGPCKLSAQEEVSLHIGLPFHLAESKVETSTHPEDLEMRGSEWHTRIRQTLGSPFETHHGFTVQVLCFSTMLRSGTGALSTAFVQRDLVPSLRPEV
jgi:hypothetical protein